MSNISKGLFWAATILLVAFFESQAMINQPTGKVLMMSLPVIAVLSLGRQGNCGLFCGEGKA